MLVLVLVLVNMTVYDTSEYDLTTNNPVVSLSVLKENRAEGEGEGYLCWPGQYMAETGDWNTIDDCNI